MLPAAADCKRFREEHAAIGDTPLKNKARIGKTLQPETRIETEPAAGGAAGDSPHFSPGWVEVAQAPGGAAQTDQLRFSSRNPAQRVVATEAPAAYRFARPTLRIGEKCGIAVQACRIPLTGLWRRWTKLSPRSERRLRDRPPFGTLPHQVTATRQPRFGKPCRPHPRPLSRRTGEGR
jgi:hypothetical protein